jgi:hypothetical protein
MQKYWAIAIRALLFGEAHDGYPLKQRSSSI